MNETENKIFQSFSSIERKLDHSINILRERQLRRSTLNKIAFKAKEFPPKEANENN